MEVEESDCVFDCLPVGSAQTEDQSKPLKFVFPGAQHAADLRRRLLSSSGRGATLLRSNKICAAAWQPEKWLKSVHRLRGASSTAVLSHDGGNKSNLVPFRLWLLYPPQQSITEEAEWKTRTIQGCSLKKAAAVITGGRADRLRLTPSGPFETRFYSLLMMRKTCFDIMNYNLI